MLNPLQHEYRQRNPVEPTTFHRAAILSLDVASGLRSGDSHHLAAALDARTKSIATLDAVTEKNVKRLKFELVAF